MKALDYLYAMKNANEQMGQEPINIIEAIKELEDLQNRTCDNCKFLDMDLICTNENTPCCSEYSGRYDNFGCSEWEQK